MQSPYVTLGVARNATTEQIRSAYHTLVKRYHPDCMRDEEAKETAQNVLVQINLAYAEAMKMASHRSGHAVGIGDPKRAAESLLRQGRLESALRMLERAGERDADWFDIKGSVLLRQGDAEAAHACFRTAVRLEPDNVRHRELALDAGVQMRKQKTIKGRVSGWARHLVGRMG